MVLWYLFCVLIYNMQFFSNTDTAGNTCLWYEILIFLKQAMAARFSGGSK